MTALRFGEANARTAMHSSQRRLCVRVQRPRRRHSASARSTASSNECLLLAILINIKCRAFLALPCALAISHSFLPESYGGVRQEKAGKALESSPLKKANISPAVKISGPRILVPRSLNCSLINVPEKITRIRPPRHSAG